MPKVVHIVRKFEPAEWGGTETHLIAMLREMRELGWESEVHAPREAGTDGAAIREAGAVFKTFRAHYPYLGMTPERRKGLVAAGGNLVSVHELARLALRTKADVLHLHTLGRLGGVVRFAAKLRHIPYAVTLHGPVRAHAEVAEQDAVRRTSGLVDLGAPFGMLVGARRVVHDADLMFVLNRKEHDAWAKVREGKHLEIVSHGVDLQRATEEARREARAGVPGLGDAPYVVVIARLDRAKGPDLAIDAFLRGAPEAMHLVLAGSVADPVYAEEVKAMAAAAGHRVHVLGGVAPKTARALLAEATLALVPSRSEPFGIVLLEAWAEGTAAVFSDVGGLSDIARRTGGTWGLVDVGNAETFAATLGRLVRDQAALTRERSEVRERVARHFTWKALAQRIVLGYERARSGR